jgi:hypothetical protein
MPFITKKIAQLPMTDVGPATPPPAWCLPDAEPSWDLLADGGDPLCTWTRNFPEPEAAALCWITAEDRIVGGRVIRTAPWIGTYEHDVMTAEDARKLAAAFLNAADVLAATVLGL